MRKHKHFSGSYRPGDVRFLLQPIIVDMIDVAAKERLIQRGERHYSELLSPEHLPSERYMAIFRHAHETNKRRMARDLLNLAAIIAAQRSGEITLVSLARAGTPIGVALKHILVRVFQRAVAHYSISIIRDRGVDANALRFILDAEGRSDASIVFVDGWTGKGVISRELDRAVRAFNENHDVQLDSRLFVLADLAGAGVAATTDDYLIPSGILNATVSGLISRSILNERIGQEDFHGCVYYREFKPHDLSVWFIDDLLKAARDLIEERYSPLATSVDTAFTRQCSQQFLRDIMAYFGIADENLVKPGIGEATRVLLRRVPERVIVHDGGAAEVAHLVQLAREKQVRCDIDPALPYQAVSLIRSLHDA